MTKELTRRSAVSLGAALVTSSVVGCSEDETSGTGGGGGGSTTGPGSAGTDGSTTVSGTSGSTTQAVASSTGTGTVGGWASGGTAAMTDKESYPDPFTDPLGNACALTPAQTLGPCYAETIDREDISEGNPGLPVRLAFLVVDTDCNPIPNATVDVWHNNIEGLYSGEDAIAMCTLNDPEAEAGRWFRGVQTGGADGKVFFDTCFPGWYAGRAIHIHYTVRVGNQEYLTSQLYFPQSLVDEIFATHVDYVAYGAPDTPNGSDGIYVPSAELDWAQMTDGAMLASKVLIVTG
jgi:protocatechuate 3,4-dioxygenase beta subunit